MNACVCMKATINAKCVHVVIHVNLQESNDKECVWVCVCVKRVQAPLSSDFPRGEFVYTGFLEHNGVLFHSKCEWRELRCAGFLCRAGKAITH